MATALGGLALVALLGAWELRWQERPDPQDRALPQAQLPDRPLRILAFGTSLTARALWPERLAAELSRCLGRPVSADRIARPGAGSDWALTLVRRANDVAPDIVILEFAINDADLLDGVSVETSILQHRELIDRLSGTKAPPAIILMTTNPVAAGWRWLQRPWLGNYYLAYRRLAAETGAGLADLWPRWTLPGPGDGLHPDPEDEADLATPVLLTIIGDRYGITCAGSGNP